MVQQEIGITYGIVIRIDQHTDMLFPLLHTLCHRLVHLKLLGIFVGIFRTVTGTGMQDDQHLTLLAGRYPLTESRKEDTIIAHVLLGILGTQLLVDKIFVNMYGRLSPVRRTPRHVDTSPVGIVRQQLIQVVRILWFENSLGSCCGVGGT